jgi:hypothetical protein
VKRTKVQCSSESRWLRVWGAGCVVCGAGCEYTEHVNFSVGTF